MDSWMDDATLNANDAVASWHQRAQRCGFKSRRLTLRSIAIIVLNRNAVAGCFWLLSRRQVFRGCGMWP